MTLYVPVHRSQYAAGSSAVTRRTGCTWTSGANGVDAISGGRKRPTPDAIHALVSSAEESNPAYPGWSMRDLVLAMSRYGVTLVNRSGDGWAAVVAWLKAGHYVVLQGDSDQFGNSTCSGTYEGDHAIGVHPNHRTVDGVREWWINDPICPSGRWERESVLQRYAVKLAASCYFGTYSQPVPELEPDPVNPDPGTRASMAIRYVPPITSDATMHLVKGQALYAAPGGARVTVMQESGDVPYLGLAPAYRGKKWRAVLVTTKGVYVDGEARPTVLYVPDAAGDIKEIAS